MNVPAFDRAMKDPSLHFWMKRLIEDIADKDPVDVLNGLAWVIEKYQEEYDKTFTRLTPKGA